MEFSIFDLISNTWYVATTLYMEEALTYIHIESENQTPRLSPFYVFVGLKSNKVQHDNVAVFNDIICYIYIIC